MPTSLAQNKQVINGKGSRSDHKEEADITTIEVDRTKVEVEGGNSLQVSIEQRKIIPMFSKTE